MEDVQPYLHQSVSNHKIAGLLTAPVKCICECHKWVAFNGKCVCICGNPGNIYPEWEQRIDLKEKIYLIALFGEDCQTVRKRQDVEKWVLGICKRLPRHISDDIQEHFFVAKMESEGDVRMFKREIFATLHAFL